MCGYVRRHYGVAPSSQTESIYKHQFPMFVIPRDKSHLAFAKSSSTHRLAFSVAPLSTCSHLSTYTLHRAEHFHLQTDGCSMSLNSALDVQSIASLAQQQQNELSAANDNVNSNSNSTKRKAEDQGGQQRARRNRYVSIAWYRTILF